MRNKLVMVVFAAILSTVLVGGPASAGHCPAGWFEMAGTVTDAATGEKLDEITSVSFFQLDGPYLDNEGTFDVSAWTHCAPAGTYAIHFLADSYYEEWWNDGVSMETATVIVLDRDRLDIDVQLDRLTRIVGQVVDAKTGVGLGGSIHVENLDRTYLDGESSALDGTFSILLSHPAQRANPDSYLLAFEMDAHWAEWYDDSRKKSTATPIVTERGVAVIDLGVIELRACPRPEICIAGSFNR